jgi:hypothetical protein
VSDVTVPPPSLPGFFAAAPTANAAARLHALAGAQFGDLEFDVGKSIRWTQWFTDTVHITDVNLGTQRYWVVNWTLTYPQAFHAVTGVNFFFDMVKFRKEQWRLAKAERGIQYDAADWVLFVDAHEGMAIDTRDPQPPNRDVEPFKSYLYREIDRAEAASKDRVSLPFYAFLRHDDTIVAHYESPAFEDGQFGYTTATCDMGTPYYLDFGGLTRLMKVSVLEDPAFDWTTIDTPAGSGDSGLNVALVSYAYAHWNLQDIVPPATEVEPLSEANDDGYRMRSLISMVRPHPDLDFGEPYSDPDDEPDGLAGPWAAEDQFTPDPEESQPVAFDPSLAGLLVPLYDSVLRINMRDGVWYEGGELGNIPLSWDEGNQTWVPRDMSPGDWHNTDTWVAPVA